MLVTCPECAQNVSDRASSCPHCGYPIAEHLEQQRRTEATTRDRESRSLVGEVDCAACEATGFVMIDDPEARFGQSFSWCRICEHTGRVALCRSDRGYFAVARAELSGFLGGTRDEGDDLVVFLGVAEPPPHRFPQAGRRHASTEE
ncbi:MAG: zinc ribbon domain-containing protein [Deltaproteobacteria bacterium]|nr:zinc ribbon domain-containing protein [Deltaproteobacteria bacterium]